MTAPFLVAGQVVADHAAWQADAVTYATQPLLSARNVTEPPWFAGIGQRAIRDTAPAGR
ncbi:hypothetical protein [Luedemannella helvata]|uniref:Uncharacterized protein n=1 Tax=Luedemannella helvata TaxID=349315 RepID=A0ABN2JUE7_9ACTN